MCWRNPGAQLEGMGTLHIQQSTDSGMDVPRDAQGIPLPLGPAHLDALCCLAAALTPAHSGDKESLQRRTKGVKQQGKMLCTFPCMAGAEAFLS